MIIDKAFISRVTGSLTQTVLHASNIMTCDIPISVGKALTSLALMQQHQLAPPVVNGYHSQGCKNQHDCHVTTQDLDGKGIQNHDTQAMKKKLQQCQQRGYVASCCSI